MERRGIIRRISDYSQSIKNGTNNGHFHTWFAAPILVLPRFYRIVPDDLPVFRGELPGQDYPPGASSTAAATAVNRNNHICRQRKSLHLLQTPQSDIHTRSGCVKPLRICYGMTNMSGVTIFHAGRQ